MNNAQKSLRKGNWIPKALLAAAMLAGLLPTNEGGEEVEGSVHIPSPPLHAGPPSAGVWLTQVLETEEPKGGVLPAGQVVPLEELLEGQKPAKKGKCLDPGGKESEDQQAIGKGCWVLMGKKPKPPPERCGVYFEHNGQCWVPVRALPANPISSAPMHIPYE